MFWEVYIVETKGGRLYTGIAKSTIERFQQHVQGDKRGAKYFRFDRPLRIVHIEPMLTRSEALKREHEIKSLSRHEKLLLITHTPSAV